MTKIPVNKDSQELLDDCENNKDVEMNTMRDWAVRLRRTRTTIRELQRQYRDILYKNLQEAYRVYIEATQSQYCEKFFEILHSQLLWDGYKIQKNTTNAAMIIYHVSEEEVATKTVHDWSSALIVAENNNVPADQFATWLESKTITGAVKERRELEKNDDEKKDRMDRARRVILRLLEIRETNPITKIEKVPAPTIEKKFASPTGLVVALGTATRRVYGEDFYGDINFSLMFAPGRDFELMLLDHLAKKIVDGVQYYERKLDEMDEQEWGEHVWERLIASEEEAEAAQKKRLT